MRIILPCITVLLKRKRTVFCRPILTLVFSLFSLSLWILHLVALLKLDVINAAFFVVVFGNQQRQVTTPLTSPILPPTAVASRYLGKSVKKGQACDYISCVHAPTLKQPSVFPEQEVLPFYLKWHDGLWFFVHPLSLHWDVQQGRWQLAYRHQEVLPARSASRSAILVFHLILLLTVMLSSHSPSLFMLFVIL